MSPQSMNVVGATQLEIYQETVNDMVKAIQHNAHRFWRQTFLTDGPLEIWEINGVRFLSNGNHRFQAALLADADIPKDFVIVVDKTHSSVPTFRFDQMVWLSGHK